MRKLSGVPFIIALIHNHQLLNHLPKSSPPNIIILGGLGFQSYKFGGKGDTNIQSTVSSVKEAEQ